MVSVVLLWPRGNIVHREPLPRENLTSGGTPWVTRKQQKMGCGLEGRWSNESSPVGAFLTARAGATDEAMGDQKIMMDCKMISY